MNLHAPTTPAHDHFFLGANHQRNEIKVWLVIALTASMMLVEIVAGTSMARWRWWRTAGTCPPMRVRC